MNITKTIDFINQHLYIGADVHKKSWKITIRLNEMQLKTFSMNPNPDELGAYIKKNYPNGIYHSVYEAGFSGFGIHKRLSELGFDNIVVSPADVPSTNKDKSGKTDKIDSRKLARELASGSLTGIYVPDIFHQQLRSLCRLRGKLKADEVRIKNRIKSMFMFYSKEIPGNEEIKHWSRRFIEWLKTQYFELAPGDDCLSIMIEELINIRKPMSQAIKQIRYHYRNNKEVKKIVDLLMTVPGIGFITAMALYTEIIDMRRFKTIDHLLSYIGLVPSVSSSGEREHVKGLTKRANNYLRPLIIESAWTSVRIDPAMTDKYNKLKRRMHGQEAIIHIAKKLVNRIRLVWREESPYTLSVVE